MQGKNKQIAFSYEKKFMEERGYHLTVDISRGTVITEQKPTGERLVEKDIQLLPRSKARTKPRT